MKTKTSKSSDPATWYGLAGLAFLSAIYLLLMAEWRSLIVVTGVFVLLSLVGIVLQYRKERETKSYRSPKTELDLGKTDLDPDRKS